MTTFTPLAVHETATPDPNEVLVSGENGDGVPQNVLLRDAAPLRRALIDTPVTIANPAWTEESGEDVPPTLANPARIPLEQQAFDAAIAQLTPPPAEDAATDDEE